MAEELVKRWSDCRDVGQVVLFLRRLPVGYVWKRGAFLEWARVVGVKLRRVYFDMLRSGGADRGQLGKGR